MPEKAPVDALGWTPGVRRRTFASMRALLLTVCLAVACGGEAVDGQVEDLSGGTGGLESLGGAGGSVGVASGGTSATGGAGGDGGAAAASGGESSASGGVSSGGTESSGGAPGSGGEEASSGGADGSGGTGDELSWEDPVCDGFTIHVVRPGECLRVEGSFYSGLASADYCFPDSFSWKSCSTVTNETEADMERRIVAKDGFSYSVSRQDLVGGDCPVPCAP
jgi:hypothetical protein